MTCTRVNVTRDFSQFNFILVVIGGFDVMTEFRIVCNGIRIHLLSSWSQDLGRRSVATSNDQNQNKS